MRHGKATCPLCLTKLDEGNLHFCYEVAFCRSCLNLASQETLREARFTLVQFIRDEHRECVKGLWFFAPVLVPPGNVVALVLDRLSQFVDMERLIESEQHEALLQRNQVHT